jgi:hypothetical protein
MRIARWLGAAVAIAAISCKKEGERRPETFEPISGASTSGDVASPAKAVGGTAGPRTSPAEAESSARPDIHVGMTREQFVSAAGDCAVRVVFVPASGSGSRYVEVFQPKPGPCIQRLEERRFTIVGGRLETIQPGLDAAAAMERAERPRAVDDPKQRR